MEINEVLTRIFPKRTWYIRFVKLWLVLLLPVSIYLCYEAYERHNNIPHYQDRVDHYLDLMERQGRGEIIYTIRTPKESFDSWIILRDESIHKRKLYLLSGIVLVTSPLSVYMLIILARWIWDPD